VLMVYVMYLLWLLQAIWHWMESYPEEFTELQKRPNDDLAGSFFCENCIQNCSSMFMSYALHVRRCCVSK